MSSWTNSTIIVQGDSIFISLKDLINNKAKELINNDSFVEGVEDNGNYIQIEIKQKEMIGITVLNELKIQFITAKELSNGYEDWFCNVYGIIMLE